MRVMLYLLACYLASHKVPVCFLQNSGLGNLVNPLTSLTDSKAYSVPSLLIIGWRGEPGIKDDFNIFFKDKSIRAASLNGNTISYFGPRQLFKYLCI